MDTLSVKYYGYVSHASGYGHAARGYIHALHSAGVVLSVVDLEGRASHVEEPLIRSLLHRPLEPDFHVFHGIPPEWARLAFPLSNAIGLTVWETSEMPAQWRNALNHAVDVWLPSGFNATVFGRSLQTSIFTLPHPVFPPPPDEGMIEANALLGTTARDWVVYCVFEWQDRKCPERVLEAYLRAFPEAAEPILVLKTNPGAAAVAHRALDAIRTRTGSSGRVLIRAEAWSDAQIAALHGRGDCYLSLHRGEGWCYPLFEAVTRGTPVIATGYSGPLDYLDPGAHHLVRYNLVPVRQPYRYYSPVMRWADPEVDHAVELLREVREHPDAARQRAERAAVHIREEYSLEKVGAAAKSRLLQLLERDRPERRHQMERQARREQMTPPVPVPAGWYDADYFELGIKSNWSEGYNWQQFSGLFGETAGFLMRIFPEAEAILDIGCAKGFLVRALRERGKACWGFDFSPWAIEHAEPDARPYLAQASVDDFAFDRSFDLLVAFEVFEHLTEAQAVRFLVRARAHTRLALLATIPSFDGDADRAQYGAHDRDLSHITLCSRRWWHERFLQAGWRQDGLHRVVQQLCQEHALPSRMEWKVYVYAP